MTDADDHPEPTPDRGADEMAVLEQLESDLAAVETAIATIDQIGADGTGGEQAAAEIGAAVGLLTTKPVLTTKSEGETTINVGFPSDFVEMGDVGD